LSFVLPYPISKPTTIWAGKLVLAPTLNVYFESPAVARSPNSVNGQSSYLHSRARRGEIDSSHASWRSKSPLPLLLLIPEGDPSSESLPRHPCLASCSTYIQQNAGNVLFKEESAVAIDRLSVITKSNNKSTENSTERKELNVKSQAVA